MNRFICLFFCCLFPIAMTAQGLTELEYFFGTDAGVGSGPTTTFTLPLDSINSAASLSTAALSPGFHEIHYRVKDSNGTYSLYQTATFYINSSNPQASSTGISSLEYFFDSDPGTGSGPTITLTSPIDTLTSGAALVTNALSPGFHTLNYRVKNENGVSSLFKKSTFYIQDTSHTISDPLVEMEFLIDGGPAVSTTGLATVLNSVDTANVALPLSFPLNPGFHSLVVRSKDLAGDWGLYQKRMFYVSDSAEHGPGSPLTGLEYFYDTDPGSGNGTFLAAGPTFSLDSLFAMPTLSLGLGWHHLYARVTDQDGAWSLIETDSFQVLSGCSIPPPVLTVSGPTTFCHGDSVQLSVASGYSSYQWSNGATSSSIWVKDSGNYSVTVVDTAGCLGTSATEIITRLPSPMPVILTDGTEFCIGDTVTLMTIGNHQSYLWSTGDTSTFLMATQAGSYSVTVTDDGCSGTSEPIQLFDYQPPTPSVIQIAADSLQSSISANNYVWYYNFSMLPDTTRSIKAIQSGTYQVQLVDGSDCHSDKSEMFMLTSEGIEDLEGLAAWRVFPNPGAGQFTISCEANRPVGLIFRLHNNLGQEIIRQTIISQTGLNEWRIDLTNQPDGVYHLLIESQEGSGGLTMVKRS